MSTLISPCIGRCCLNTEDVCIGCFRRLAEITTWSQADMSTKQVIINNAESRRQKASDKTVN